MKTLAAVDARHNFLVFQGVFVCILQALAASTLPALEYLWVFNGRDDRWSVEQYVHWGVATFPAILGIIALGSRSQAWLALHVAVGTMFGAALAANNVNAFNTLDTRCLLGQAAYNSCGACPCAATNSCTQAQLAASACQGCTAPSLDLCTAFASNRIVVAIAGAVTVVAMAVPVAVSLVLLARLAAQQAMRWGQLAAARLRAQERLELLGEGLAPSLPAACVRGDIHSLERSRVAELQALAAQLQAALTSAGYPDAGAGGLDSGKAAGAWGSGAAAALALGPAPPLGKVASSGSLAATDALPPGSIEAPLLIPAVPGLSALLAPAEPQAEAAIEEKKKKKKKKRHVEVAGDDALLPDSEPGSPDARV